MPKTVKGGPLRFFNHSVAKFQKIEGDPLKSLKNFRKKNKKTRIFNSLIVPKKSKRRDPSEFFNIRSVSKYHSKLKGGPFEDIKKFSKSLTKPKKGRSLIVPKK